MKEYSQEIKDIMYNFFIKMGRNSNSDFNHLLSKELVFDKLYTTEPKENITTYISGSPKFKISSSKFKNLRRLQEDINFQNEDGNTFLHLLAKNQTKKHFFETFERIFDKHDGKIKFDFLLKNNKNEFFYEELLNNITDIDNTEHDSRYLNSNLSMSGYIKMIDKCLELTGFDINISIYNKWIEAYDYYYKKNQDKLLTINNDYKKPTNNNTAKIMIQRMEVSVKKDIELLQEFNQKINNIYLSNKLKSELPKNAEVKKMKI